MYDMYLPSSFLVTRKKKEEKKYISRGTPDGVN